MQSYVSIVALFTNRIKSLVAYSVMVRLLYQQEGVCWLLIFNGDLGKVVDYKKLCPFGKVRSLQSTRESSLLENVSYKPSYACHRVYVLVGVLIRTGEVIGR